MNNEVAISVKNLSKSFKVPHEKHDTLKSKAIHIFSSRKFSKYIALEDISFDIKKGEFFGIVGKNGCGKSTLLKILASIYTPTKGKVSVTGNIAPFIELGVGFNPELTGRENVFLSGTILGLSRKKIEKLYDEIVNFAELTEFMDQKLKNYSSGMQVRLAFSIAVRAESEVLLIDEVLAVGDAAFQTKCFDYFYKLKNSNKTIVFVSHDMETIKKFCDKALYIKEGKIAKFGNTNEVADQYSMDNYSSIQENVIDVKDKNNNINNTTIYIKRYKPENKFIKKGQDIELKVIVVSKKDEYVNIGVSIVRDDGVYVAGFNSTRDLPKLKLEKGENIFKCTMASNQLTKNRYKINFAVFNANKLGLIDSLNGCEYITVLDSDSTKDGVFNINGRWEKEQ